VSFNLRSTSPGATISGKLTANGTVSGSNFSGNFSGNTMEQGLPVSYSGILSGNFVGDGAAAMVGTGSGTGTVAGIGTLPIYSYWGAEKQ